MQTSINMAQAKSKINSIKSHAAGASPASPAYACTYDAILGSAMVSNMTSRSEGAKTENYTYGDSNHVHAVTSLIGGSSFAYDATPRCAMDGNMTSRDHEDTTYLQKFDV